jgi:hypothetical protein
VSSVAATNLLTGALLFYVAFWFARLPPGDFSNLNTFVLLLAAALALLGVVHLFAAVAVWKRWRGGQILAIILSALPALCAVLVLVYFTDVRPYGAVLLAWAAYPNIVLLQRRYAAEFPPVLG